MTSHTRTALVSILLLSLATACVPASIRRLPQPALEASARLTVFRQTAFNSVAVNAIVGVDGQDVAELPTSSFTSLVLPAGEHEIYVRVVSDRPYRIRRTLRPGEELVFEVVPSSANFVKVLFPITYFLSSSFHLRPSERGAFEGRDLKDLGS